MRHGKGLRLLSSAVVERLEVPGQGVDVERFELLIGQKEFESFDVVSFHRGEPILGVDPSAIYFAAGAVSPRPVLPIYMSRTHIKADGKRLATITGLPQPTTVSINGEPHVIVDGRLDLISDMPAQYQLVIDQWPYLPWSATVTAT